MTIDKKKLSIVHYQLSIKNAIFVNYNKIKYVRQTDFSRNNTRRYKWYWL